MAYLSFHVKVFAYYILYNYNGLLRLCNKLCYYGSCHVYAKSYVFIIGNINQVYVTIHLSTPLTYPCLYSFNFTSRCLLSTLLLLAILEKLLLACSVHNTFISSNTTYIRYNFTIIILTFMQNEVLI